MLTDFKHYFTGRLNSKCVTTLPCEMFAFKNAPDPVMNGANCHAKLSHLKQLLKNIYLMMLAQFW